MEMEYNILVKKSTVCSLQVSHTVVLLPEIVEKAITEMLQNINVHLTSLPYVFSGILHCKTQTRFSSFFFIA